MYLVVFCVVGMISSNCNLAKKKLHLNFDVIIGIISRPICPLYETIPTIQVGTLIWYNQGDKNEMKKKTIENLSLYFLSPAFKKFRHSSKIIKLKYRNNQLKHFSSLFLLKTLKPIWLGKIKCNYSWFLLAFSFNWFWDAPHRTKAVVVKNVMISKHQANIRSHDEMRAWSKITME